MKYLEDLENYYTHEHICLCELLEHSQKIYKNKGRFKKYCKCRKKLDQDELVNKYAKTGEQQCDTCPYFICVEIFKDKLCLSGIEEMQKAYKEEINKLD